MCDQSHVVAQNLRDKIMERNDTFFQSISQKMSKLETNFQTMQAFLDQKIDQLEGEIENLESRINNLR